LRRPNQAVTDLNNLLNNETQGTAEIDVAHTSCILGLKDAYRV